MPSKIDRYKIPREYDRRRKTTDEDVEKMRELYHEGLTQKIIADIFGVSQSAVSYAVSDKAKDRLTEYRKHNPSKNNRTKEQSRRYSKELRARKKAIIELERRERLERLKRREYDD